MRTKTIAVLLSLAMLLALLPGCGAEKEPEEPAPPEVLLPAEDIARAVSSAASDEPEDGPETLGEQMEAYVEAAYGLSADKWEDCAVLRAAGMRAYEIAVLRFADEAGTAYGEEQLGSYRNSRRNAFTGYAPDEAALVSGAKICRIGNYVGLFICEDPAGAEELFTSILESGEVPEAVVKPEPEPVAKPEPIFGLGEDQILWIKLLGPLEDLCRSEIDAIRAEEDVFAFGNYLSSSYQNFFELAENDYGLPPDQLVEGAIDRSLLSDKYALEFTVFRMVDEESAKENMSGLTDYCNTRILTFTDADDEAQLAILEGARIVQEREYLGFFACEDAETAGTIFKETLDELFPLGQSVVPDNRDTEDSPRVEIAEGVFVSEARWPEPEGEEDPDHPGRLKFMPAGNELMEVYDTSAIVDAWKTGDPSGLSEDDRDIYDKAKEVLDGILRDGMSDLEKEIEIYDWVLRNVDYYTPHMDALAEDERDAYTPYGGLVNGEAVCLGYAATFQILTELAGLESMTVVGAAEMTEEHGWTMVRLNGEWYCADPTWDWSSYIHSTIFEPDTANEREWNYFNVTSDYMARTHHQWDYDAIPEATAGDYGAPAR